MSFHSQSGQHPRRTHRYGLREPLSTHLAQSFGVIEQGPRCVDALIGRACIDPEGDPTRRAAIATSAAKADSEVAVLADIALPTDAMQLTACVGTVHSRICGPRHGLRPGASIIYCC